VRFHAEAEVIDVAGLVRPPSLRGNQIDHAPTGPKLNQTELGDATLLGESEDADVKIKGSLRVAASENDMIELCDFEGPIHRDTP
jgi:hypothetical protein